MIVEYVRYAFPDPVTAAKFEAAYAEVGHHLSDAAECLRWELAHGVEEPLNYTVRIEWTSIEGHVRGFRRSAAFKQFFGTLKHFGDHRMEMAHFEPFSAEVDRAVLRDA